MASLLAVRASAGRHRQLSPSRSSRNNRATDSVLLQHHSGAGPTIHSTVHVSREETDLAFVQAASRGDVNALRELLPNISSIDVRCRPGKGRPSTALHVAAASGALEAAKVLLEAGADPSPRMEWLRSLTPLHLAGTVAMARSLLQAGAQPLALDPREPDPVWYQRSQGRHEVADVIAAARTAAQRAVAQQHAAQRQQRQFQQRAHAPTAESPRRQVMPSLTAADIALVREAWSLSPAAAAKQITRQHQKPPPQEPEPPQQPEIFPWQQQAAEPTGAEGRRPSVSDVAYRVSLSPHARRENDSRPASSEAQCEPCRECSICMGDLGLPAQDEERRGSHNDNERLILLPCGKGSATPHVFHASCLEKWLYRKATCPACRQDVRPMLRASGVQQPQPQQPQAEAPASAERAASPRAQSPRKERPQTPRTSLRQYEAAVSVWRQYPQQLAQVARSGNVHVASHLGSASSGSIVSQLVQQLPRPSSPRVTAAPADGTSRQAMRLSSARLQLRDPQQPSPPEGVTSARALLTSPRTSSRRYVAVPPIDAVTTLPHVSKPGWSSTPVGQSPPFRRLYA